MQVSTAEAKRRGISPESLLEPCTNLRVGWQILEDDYQIEKKTYGPGQEALQHAISRYNTGDTQQGIANGYLGRVFAAVRRLASRATNGEAMSVLSSERPHDQGVKHSMANNRWNDAPALPAAQTIDNASNDRQCPDRFRVRAWATANTNATKSMTKISNARFRAQLSSYKEKSVIHQAAKEQLFCYWRDEYRPQHFSRRYLSIDRQTPASSHIPRTARRG